MLDAVQDMERQQKLKNATRARKRLGGAKAIDPRDIRDELLQLSIRCSALASARDDDLVELAQTYRDEMVDMRELSRALDSVADDHFKRLL